MPDPQEPISVKDFSSRVKAKYPEYKDVDDLLLAQKMVEKYPEYKSQVLFEPVKKKKFHLLLLRLYNLLLRHHQPQTIGDL